MQLNKARVPVVILLVVALAMTALVAVRHLRNDYSVTAMFSSSPGLYKGNDVVVLGVKTGTITDIHAVGNKVRVTMRLDRGVELAADAFAVLLPRSLVTDRVVELTPIATSGPTLADGAVIPVERTRTPVEFQDVVKSVNTLSTELASLEKRTGVVDDFLAVSADNARGNGKRLRDTLLGVQSALAGITKNPDDTVELIRQLSNLTSVMADNDGVISSFSRHLTEASATFKNEGRNTTVALRALVAALTDVSDLVTRHRSALKAGIDGLGDAAGVIGKRRVDLAKILDLVPLLMQNAILILDKKRNLVRARLTISDSVLDGGLVPGLCREVSGLPLCSAADPSLLGPDLGITELLTGGKR